MDKETNIWNSDTLANYDYLMKVLKSLPQNFKCAIVTEIDEDQKPAAVEYFSDIGEAQEGALVPCYPYVNEEDAITVKELIKVFEKYNEENMDEEELLNPGFFTVDLEDYDILLISDIPLIFYDNQTVVFKPDFTYSYEEIFG